MGLVVVTSPGTSPGATSLCVGLAMAWKGWGLDPLLIEADPLGGVLGHRFGVSGARAQRNLLTFAVDTRRIFRDEAMAKNLNEIGGFDAILAPVDPVRAQQAIQQASPVIAEQLATSSRPIVADLGRIHQDSVALRLARAADAAYIVLQPRTDQIQAALFQLSVLRQQGLHPQLVLIGDKPFHPDEVSIATDAPIAAILPYSPKAAVALSGGKFKSKPFTRSPLWRSIVALARPLATELAKGEPLLTEQEHDVAEAIMPVEAAMPVEAVLPVETVLPVEAPMPVEVAMPAEVAEPAELADGLPDDVTVPSGAGRRWLLADAAGAPPAPAAPTAPPSPAAPQAPAPPAPASQAPAPPASVPQPSAAPPAPVPQAPAARPAPRAPQPPAAPVPALSPTDTTTANTGPLVDDTPGGKSEPIRENHVFVWVPGQDGGS